MGHGNEPVLEVASGDTVIVSTRDVSDDQIGPDSTTTSSPAWTGIASTRSPARSPSAARSRATRSRSRSSTSTPAAGAGPRSCRASASWPTTSRIRTCAYSTLRGDSSTSARTSRSRSRRSSGRWASAPGASSQPIMPPGTFGGNMDTRQLTKAQPCTSRPGARRAVQLRRRARRPGRRRGLRDRPRVADVRRAALHVQKERTILSPQYQTPPGSLTRKVDTAAGTGRPASAATCTSPPRTPSARWSPTSRRPTACPARTRTCCEPVRRPQDLGDRRRRAVHRQRAAAARRVHGVSTAEACRLGAAEAARRIAAGDLSSAALVAACLERIAEREETVRAWAHLDPAAALAQARERDAQPPRGPLHGVPVGVKDIVDTADLPTERGSVIHAGRRPGADAACVARLRAAGAVILGKTVTTEFAYFSPARPATRPTRHARRAGHPAGRRPPSARDGPGRDRLADRRVGDPPGGVLRHARAQADAGRRRPPGVMALSGNLDTLGWFAREAEDLALLGRVLARDGPPARRPGSPAARVRARPHPVVGPRGRRRPGRGHGAAERLAAAGASVRELDLPERFAGLPDAQDAVMALDMARSLPTSTSTTPTS